MKFCTFLFLSVTLVSCEYKAQLSYNVKNNTNTIIKVISTSTYNKVSTDTVFIIPNSQAKIAVNSYGVGSVGKHKEVEETLRNFSKMDVFINDTTKSVTNFLLTERWIYEQTTKNRGSHLLTVSATDF